MVDVRISRLLKKLSDVFVKQTNITILTRTVYCSVNCFIAMFGFFLSWQNMSCHESGWERNGPLLMSSCWSTSFKERLIMSTMLRKTHGERLWQDFFLQRRRHILSIFINFAVIVISKGENLQIKMGIQKDDQQYQKLNLHTGSTSKQAAQAS